MKHNSFRERQFLDAVIDSDPLQKTGGIFRQGKSAESVLQDDFPRRHKTQRDTPERISKELFGPHMQAEAA